MVTAPTVRARALRNNATKAEAHLWARLRLLRNNGYQFRRQRPFRGYFLDFVCIDRMLVVEVDGSIHHDPRQAEHDAIRDNILARAGYKVMRFENGVVFSEIDWVMDSINRALEARPSTRGD